MSYIHYNYDFKDHPADNIEPAENLNFFNKRELHNIAKKLGVDYTPEHTKEQLVGNILSKVATHPENLLCIIPRPEFPLLIELFEAEPTQGVERRYRSLSYLIMRLGMAVASEDNYRRIWGIILPTKIKDIIREDLPYFKKLYQENKPFPTPEEYRQIRKAQDTEGETDTK